MEIKTIKINSYGKLKNKEINFKKNINIIYGENESGKSTLLKFIINSLYGTSKNKKGKNISDFEKYKPWEGEDFSGKLIYELDNKNKYEIFREFNKKNPKIFNGNGEDITNEYNIDKNKGSEFFYDQTQISEEMFLATSVAMQQEVKIGKDAQNFLIQKISNVLGTGEDNISYKKAIEKLNKKQLEKIGTERSREKPLNIIEKEIEKNKEKINEIKKYENLQYEIEEEKNKIKINIEKNKIKNELLKEIKKIKGKNNLENEKIKINEKIIEENKNKINEIENKIINIKNNFEKEKNKKNKFDVKYEKNKLNKKIKMICIIILLINIFWILFIPKIIENEIFKYIFLLTVPVTFIYIIFLKNKLNKKIKIKEKNYQIEFEKINLEENNLKNEKNIIKKNIEEINDKINKLKIENNIKNNLKKENILNKYSNKFNKTEINYFFNIEKIEEEILYLENKINENKIEINKLEFKKENIENQLNDLSKIEEDLNILNEQYNDLQKMNNSIELTKKLLEKAYEKMKNNISPIFAKKLSQNISEITNGKYNNLFLNDEKGLIVELDNGNYVPAERLSIGTIDQLYLSLRLGMLDEISKEKIPIILDEAFAYFDKNRLKNILNFLHNKYNDRQIIIFTCTLREKEILEEEKIWFNYIKI